MEKTQLTEIQKYILRNGKNMTNEQMRNEKGIATYEFAGYIAAMKRNLQIPKTGFLKSDTKSKSSRPVSIIKKTVKHVNAPVAKKVVAAAYNKPHNEIPAAQLIKLRTIDKMAKHLASMIGDLIAK